MEAAGRAGSRPRVRSRLALRNANRLAEWCSWAGRRVGLALSVQTSGEARPAQQLCIGRHHYR
jgi:hypothetical protein